MVGESGRVPATLTSRCTELRPSSNDSIPSRVGTVLSETAARWLLVLHTALGVAAVGAATHLVLWLRKALRNKQAPRSVRRFAWLVVALHAGGFLVGNLVYPTYRVEVRATYLEDPTAVVAAP